MPLGRDPVPGLLAGALADDGRAMRLWFRTPAGVKTEVVPFQPFALLADRALIEGAPGVVEVEALEGAGDLRWLARFASWPEALAARDLCRARSGREPSEPTAPYRIPADPMHQYLLLTGRTGFGGLAFDDLRRLALDIEVVTGEGFEFPSAARADDRIVAVALADSTGFRHVIRGNRLDERALLEECGRIIRERDPDVIEGHNIFRFDLEYLAARAARHGLTLDWGRDGSVLTGRPARLQIAERTIGYRRFSVAGRHIVDTWILALLHDVGVRDLPGLGLKDIARHWGVAAADRTYLDAGRLARELAADPERVMAYALDDAVETLAVAARLAPPYFAQARLVPFDYQTTILRGAAAKIDALILREYLHRRRAVPRPRPVAPVGGGHVAIYRQGVGRPALHVDVRSLYPSLMLAHDIRPAADDLGVFPTLLRHLTDVRLAARRRSQEAPEGAERQHFAALQQSFKLLINAFYGYLAFSHGHWNDFAAADRVTAEGRAVITGIVERLRALGAVPLEADTDGVYFVPPPGHGPGDDERLLEQVAADLPAGIRLELDGRYAAFFSYKPKTYAALDEQGRLTVRGSAFRSRGLEPFQRLLMEDLLRLILEGRGAEAARVVERWLADFAARRVSLRLFARTETLTETAEEYRERVEAGLRHPSAAYELALAAGRAWQPGDQVSYYVAGRSADVVVNERARLASHWDPARPDENVEYYQAKVLEVWERLRPFAIDDRLREPAVEEPSPQLTLF